MKRLLLATTALVSAPSLASPDPVKDTRTIMAGTVTTTKIKNEYISGARDGTAPFKGALSAYKAVRAAEPPLTVKCADGTVIVAPGACPVVVVQPVPIPPVAADNPMAGRALGLGAPDIATADHNVMDDLYDVPVLSPEPTAAGEGAFRFICRHTTLLYDDPTVYPGQPGKSHLHDQTGVYNWNAFSNYGNLRREGGGSGCNDVAGYDKNPAKINQSANRTPYWQPALLDGKGNVIVANWIQFYYKRRNINDPILSGWKPAPSPDKAMGIGADLPNGIKFLFGADTSNLASPYTSQNAGATKVAFQCIKAAGGIEEYHIDMRPALKCAASAVGNDFTVRTEAPTCWDGKNLDTADHRSHLMYADYSGGWGYLQCPKTHPYVIPTFSYIASYTILPTDDVSLIRFSSDHMDMTKPPGWSFHVDYGPAAWDPIVLKMWHDNCINRVLSCTGGNLGNGKALKGALAPLYNQNGVWTSSWKNPVRLVPVPTQP